MCLCAERFFKHIVDSFVAEVTRAEGGGCKQKHNKSFQKFQLLTLGNFDSKGEFHLSEKLSKKVFISFLFGYIFKEFENDSNDDTVLRSIR